MRKDMKMAWAALIIAVMAGVPVGGSRAPSAATAGSNPPQEGTSPSVVLKTARLIQMPGVEVPERKLLHAVDSNSPVHRDGKTLYLFNSYEHPYRVSGPSLERLGNREPVRFNGLDDKLDIWIEATWKDPDGTLYGAYHYEPDTVCFSNGHLPTAPRIGWIKSEDNGKTWKDLGFIIQASPCAINCKSASPWDAGGTGDFVFNLDREKRYFYFYGLYSTICG